MPMSDEDDLYPDIYPNYYYDESGQEDDGDEPLTCGPWCGECWGGDGICMQEIEAMAIEAEEYEKNHVAHDVTCPVCQQKLTQFEVLTDKLWVWPGGWYNVFIALNVYAIMDAAKDELHRQDNICHIWIGEGKNRREQLIKLIGEPGTESENQFSGQGTIE